MSYASKISSNPDITKRWIEENPNCLLRSKSGHYSFNIKKKNFPAEEDFLFTLKLLYRGKPQETFTFYTVEDVVEFIYYIK